MIGHRPTVVKVFVSLALVVGACGGGGPSPSNIAAPTALTSPPPIQRSATTSATPITGASAQPATPPGEQTTAPATPGSSPGAALGWAELQIASGPSAREDHTWTVAADGITAYLFGGRAQVGPSDELWQFDLVTSTWTRLEPDGSGPEARFGHTATWVPEIGLVIWSGQGRSGFFDDIWRFQPSANSWTKLEATGDIPAARYGSCAAYGPDGQLWISHGFTQDSGRFSDTRSYDFATGTWTDRTTHHAVPVQRCLHDCYWSSGNQLILYGGQTTGQPALGDLWSFDLASASWTQATNPVAPPRQLYGLAARGDTAVIYGGGSVDRGFLDDTWRLDAAVPELTEIEAGSAPPARSGAALIVDPGSGEILLFGGQGEAGLFADAWVLSGAL